jgi:CDP-paratose 2-epimerase
LSFRRENSDSTVVAFDNLKRRSSELALYRLAAADVEFRLGDIRNPEDFADTGSFDLLVECSGEPRKSLALWGRQAFARN